MLDVASIQTKDGHFNEYMHWLATDWKHQEEAMKKAGVITDYHVWLVQNQRAGEPDIFLTQTFKNMAVFDASQAQQYALQAKIAGSIMKSDHEQAARGSIRTIMGDMMLREAVLKYVAPRKFLVQIQADGIRIPVCSSRLGTLCGWLVDCTKDFARTKCLPMFLPMFDSWI